MYIEWGSKEESLSLGTSERKYYCENCEEMRMVDFTMRYKHNHLYHIFGYVSSKEYLSFCSECGAQMDIDPYQMEMFKGNASIPFMRRFGCLTLFVIVAIFVTIGIAVDEKPRHQRGSNEKKAKEAASKISRITSLIGKTLEKMPEDKAYFKSKEEYKRTVEQGRACYKEIQEKFGVYLNSIRSYDFTPAGGTLHSCTRQYLIPSLKDLITASEKLYELDSFVEDEKQLSEAYACLKLLQEHNVNQTPSPETIKKLTRAEAKWNGIVNLEESEPYIKLFNKALQKYNMFTTKATWFE